MKNTIPKKALVALPDFNNFCNTGTFRIVTPEEAFVPAFDRSFHFGDSIYEVIRTYNGILFSADEHLARLYKSAKLAAFEKMPNEKFIRQMIHETCKAYFNKFENKDVYVRITVSRGFGDTNIDTKYSSDPYSLVFVKELDSYPKTMYEQGVEFSVVSRRRNPPEAIDPAMKSGNYLNNILALKEATDKNASDAIMLSMQGFVTEGTTNNVFMVKDGVVYTSPLSVGILAGITRDFVFDTCAKDKVPCEERLFKHSDLLSADEMFLTSTTKEVVAITKLDGKAVNNGVPGPITKKISRLIRDYIEQRLQEDKNESYFK